VRSEPLSDLQSGSANAQQSATNLRLSTTFSRKLRGDWGAPQHSVRPRHIVGALGDAEAAGPGDYETRFLDDSYLRLLVEVIGDGNRSGLELRKSAVNLNPATYWPEDAEESEGFFTLGDLVRDMWRDCEFEPFKDKT